MAKQEKKAEGKEFTVSSPFIYGGNRFEEGDKITLKDSEVPHFAQHGYIKNKKAEAGDVK